MDQPEGWYVIRQAAGKCTIAQVVSSQVAQDDNAIQNEQLEQWGPYATQAEAIARRVGLIRAGKCTPA
jgi:hypothetical protein